MKILVYGKRDSQKLFRAALRIAIKNVQFIGISNFKGHAEIWSGDYLYSSRFDNGYTLPENDLDDIIQRDRFLCRIEDSIARLLVRRYWHGVWQLLETDISLVMTTSVDMFTVDIIQRVAELKNIPIISPLGSFISGYAWFTVRGERTPLCREVSAVEAESVYQNLIKNDYLPNSKTNNIRKTHKDIKYFYYRRKIIEMLINPLRRHIEHDRYNPEYSVRLFSETRLSDVYTRSLDGLFYEPDWSQLDIDRTVYLPMHLIPEATTLYWCQDVARLGYLRYLLKIIDSSDNDVLFLVKEHPAMYGRRLLSFYSELLTRSNVRLIHPKYPSNNLLEHINTVVVDTGSVGVEALIRGKRVIATNDSYYSALHPGVLRADSVSSDMLEAPPIEYDPLVFLNDLLSGLFPSDYLNSKHQDRFSSEQLAEGISLFVKAKGF